MEQSSDYQGVYLRMKKAFFIIYIYSMCYFKHLKEVPSIQQIFDKPAVEQSSQGSVGQIENIQVLNIPLILPQFYFSSYSSKLGDLVRMIKSNNSLICSIQEKMVGEEQEKNNKEEYIKQELPPRGCRDDILCKLFKDMPVGFNQNLFNFKLNFDLNLPSKFYKHRKYSISVKLVPLCARSTRIILNSNPLNICIGIFDKDGNWVHENLLGEPILDGITQVSLYQGKAEFPRLLFNEISSNFPKQRLNIAIYVLPGFNYPVGGRESQNFVNWKSIKPLTLRNVTVLSKKRKKIQEQL